MLFRSTWKIVLLFFAALMPVIASAQQTGATVRGVVADPESAVIPGATVTFTPASGKALITQSQSDGTYVLRGVPPGSYAVTVTMAGFASFVKQGVRVAAGQALTLDVQMAIQQQQQEVNVTAQAAQVSVDADSNASSTVLKGKDLDALSDDPDELSSELTALAGPAAGPNGGQIYVDGFTGGQLPPKSSIREIRINQNPFSAQYDRLGYGRVEVFTKPGTDKFHGQFNLQGMTSALNSDNPLLNAFNSPGQPEQTQPPYHTIFVLGNITGPLAKNASFTLSGSHRSIQDNSLVSATILNPTNLGDTSLTCPVGQISCNYSVANPLPQSRTDINPRIDLALGEKNTLVTRFQYEQNDQDNVGVGGLVLPDAGYTSSTSETTLQVVDTQIVSQRVINETRFEYQREAASQTALNTTPTILVQGNFTGGGSNSGSYSSTQNHFEGQNYTSIQFAKNFVRLGARLRSTGQFTSTTAGTNGEFVYNCLLITPCTASTSYQANQASQFSLTKVVHPVSATMVDFGVYAEDDWKARPNLSISYGIRYETQNYLSSHYNFAPRLSIRYGVTPKTVLNTGFGIFYDRYQLTNIVTTLESNGTNQIQTQIVNPSAACTPQTIAACTIIPGSTGNKTVQGSPNLRAPYTLHYAVGVDQQLFRGATLSLNYVIASGVHQFYTANLNSPTSFVNGQPVYPIPPAPLQHAAIQDTYESGGVFHQQQLIINANIRPSRVWSVSGYGVFNSAKADTGTINTFPSINPYNIGEDYGRAVFDVRYRFFIFGNLSLPHAISVSPLMIFSAGTPYNITTGSDLNGDGQYNDRPAFGQPNGIPAGTPGTNTIAGCGSFLSPKPNTPYTPIPINYCTGPNQFTTNLRITKTFGFGESTRAPAQGQGGGQGGPGGPGGPGGIGGGRGGGGGGRGGLGGGPGGGFGGGGGTGKRYNLAFGVQFLNLFNNLDLSTPNGTLTSQQFGRSTQLAGRPFTSNSALRQISLQTSFTF
jgi:Carboxypeptidase regulatory-like domain/TonB dependent receptor